MNKNNGLDRIASLANTGKILTTNVPSLAPPPIPLSFDTNDYSDVHIENMPEVFYILGSRPPNVTISNSVSSLAKQPYGFKFNNLPSWQRDSFNQKFLFIGSGQSLSDKRGFVLSRHSIAIIPDGKWTVPYADLTLPADLRDYDYVELIIGFAYISMVESTIAGLKKVVDHLEERYAVLPGWKHQQDVKWDFESLDPIDAYIEGVSALISSLRHNL